MLIFCFGDLVAHNSSSSAIRRQIVTLLIVSWLKILSFLLLHSMRRQAPKKIGQECSCDSATVSTKSVIVEDALA